MTDTTASFSIPHQPPHQTKAAQAHRTDLTIGLGGLAIWLVTLVVVVAGPLLGADLPRGWVIGLVAATIAISLFALPRIFASHPHQSD